MSLLQKHHTNEDDANNKKYLCTKARTKSFIMYGLLLIICMFTTIVFIINQYNEPKVNGATLNGDNFNSNINRYNPGECIISPVFPMGGPAGCRDPCTEHKKYKSGMSFHGPWNSTDGTNEFVNNYIKATNIIKNNRKYKYYTLDYERSVGIHMALQYTCCLSFIQTTILDKVYANFTFEPFEIRFEKTICVLDGRYNKGWNDKSSHISLVIMPDQISMQRLYQITDKFEQEAIKYDGFGCWKQTRRESQPFHVTLGVMYGNYSYVEEAVNEINNEIKVWNHKPILIEASKLQHCNTEKKGHLLKGYDHYFDCLLPKPAKKHELLHDNYRPVIW